MEFTTLSLETMSLLFIVAIIAGFLDTLAGGGGLISTPALFLSGIPPLAALGTNKLQGSMGTATATYMMFKYKKINWEDVKYLMLSAFIGSALGTFALQFINADIVSFVIPVVLFLTAIYFVISPVPKDKPTDKTSSTPPKSMSHPKYKNLVIPTIGWYDGMFGPGTGSFFALAGVTCRGHDLITSTAVAKPLNFATNIAALIVFLFAGQVVWSVGLLMMIGQVIGARLGSQFLFKINPAYLRWIVVLMCIGMLIKYGYSMGWLG